jgi:hypothetical protein
MVVVLGKSSEVVRGRSVRCPVSEVVRGRAARSATRVSFWHRTTRPSAVAPKRKWRWRRPWSRTWTHSPVERFKKDRRFPTLDTLDTMIHRWGWNRQSKTSCSRGSMEDARHTLHTAWKRT